MLPWRTAHDPPEGCAEGGFRFVAERPGDGGNRIAGIRQLVAGEQYSPVGQVFHGRFADRLFEFKSKGGSRHAGALSQVLGGGSGGGCKSGVTVPFKSEGTTADPKFVPDVGGVAAGMLKTQLGCAGSGLTGAKNLNPTNLNPTNPTSAIGGLFKKPKP